MVVLVEDDEILSFAVPPEGISTRLDKWLATGFKKKKNVDLWLRFNPLYRKHEVTFHWLKGHAGHPENERCDTLAVEAYKQPDLPPDSGYIQEEETLFEQ